VLASPEGFVVPSRLIPPAVAVALALLADAPALAQTQGTLQARYTGSLAGIPLGRATWTVELSGDQYTAAAAGKVSGLLQVFASGQGAVEAKGTVNGGKPVTATYASNVVSDKKLDTVRIAVAAGTVKDFSAEPPLVPAPDRVPVTEAHRRGVVDPMSATLMPVAGNGNPLKPEACNRTLAIFDGRGRFDIALSYKRMERVRSEQGYDGPVLVCMVKYRPVSGHRANRWAIRYLMESRDIEVALAPIGDTRVLIPYRISVPTTLGVAVLEATHFVTSSEHARHGSVPAHAKTTF
jgi:Protein of unknown function (DUF3108)